MQSIRDNGPLSLIVAVGQITKAEGRLVEVEPCRGWDDPASGAGLGCQTCVTASSAPGPRDYLVGTERALYAFARTTCYFPGCKTPVIVFVEGEPVSNAQIAHIRGANPGSPRYDPAMTDDERRS